MEMLETNFEVLEYEGLTDIDLGIVLTLLMLVHNVDVYDVEPNGLTFLSVRT